MVKLFRSGEELVLEPDLLELRAKLNWGIWWICSSWIACNEAINQGIQIRLQGKSNLS